MQASRTTWERRSLAESLNAASMSRSCCGNPSNSAAPARSSERTFFSWKTGRTLSARRPPEQRWRRGAGGRLQPPLGAPSPAYRRTARLESWPWLPPPPCWSRSAGGKDRKGETKRKKDRKCPGLTEASNLHGGDVLEGLDEVLLVHRSGSRAVPPCTETPSPSRRGRWETHHMTARSLTCRLAAGGGGGTPEGAHAHRLPP